MYSALEKAVARAFPERAAMPRARWLVLEDNDPGGYKSTLAVARKRALRMEVMALPPRSPDLNVLDCSLWVEINKCLRTQQAEFQVSFRVTPAQFSQRLRTAATTLPASVVQNATQSMKGRCQQILENKGRLIHE